VGERRNVTRFQGYLRGALQRRIFFWFGVSIRIASVASTRVTWIVGGLGEPAWRQQLEAGRGTGRGPFVRVLGSPREPEELARPPRARGAGPPAFPNHPARRDVGGPRRAALELGRLPVPLRRAINPD